MANNLFISYELSSPAERSEQVAGMIQAMGPWAKIHPAQFYVSAALSAEEAAHQLWAAMHPSDKLLVLDATNNQVYWFNFPDDVARQMRHYWRA